MTLALALVIRSSAILAFGLLLVACLGRRSAALRHMVLATTIACAALVVPFSFVLPAWKVALPVASPTIAATAPVATPRVRTAATLADSVSTAPTSLPAPVASRRSLMPLLWLMGV